MQFNRLIYHTQLHGGRFVSRAARAVRRILEFALNDPPVRMPVHGIELTMPLSHRLPEFLHNHPRYDSLLHRLSTFIRKKQGRLICIDVGANIGDSLAACSVQPSDSFLAIEPHPTYSAYLRENWGMAPNVTISSSICSTVDNRTDLKLTRKASSAQITGAEPASCNPKSACLDSLCQQKPFWAETNLIKLDTDGHDLAILLGAPSLVSRLRPAIMFECDFNAKEDFSEAASAVFQMLREASYESLILYDNLGCLFGTISLNDLDAFVAMIRYARQRPPCYWDALAMTPDDLEAFYYLESQYAETFVPKY